MRAENARKARSEASWKAMTVPSKGTWVWAT